MISVFFSLILIAILVLILGIKNNFRLRAVRVRDGE